MWNILLAFLMMNALVFGSTAPINFEDMEKTYPNANPISSDFDNLSLKGLYLGGQVKNQSQADFLISLGIQYNFKLNNVSEGDDTAYPYYKHYVYVPAGTDNYTESRSIAQILEVMNEVSGPFYVHCTHGANRTGGFRGVILKINGVDNATIEADMRSHGASAKDIAFLHSKLWVKDPSGKTEDYGVVQGDPVGSPWYAWKDVIEQKHLDVFPYPAIADGLAKTQMTGTNN